MDGYASMTQKKIEPKNSLDRAWILVFFFLALSLRLFGNRYGLPWIEEPDPDTLMLARSLADGTLGWDALLEPSRYPFLLVYLLAPLLKLFPDTSVVWIGRTVSGFLGAGTVVFPAIRIGEGPFKSSYR